MIERETEKDGVGDLRLGDITYSNCFPVHARLIHSPRQGDPRLVRGVPSVLNRLLEEGEIDVSPSSSIEYARNADRYRILPDLVIGSRGPVRSILFLSRCEPERLDGRLVALPSASATSVVLLKILLRQRWQTAARFTWFDQASEDPFVAGADAALFIGDVALRPGLHEQIGHRYDLGEVWYGLTGLPFAFAVWQASGGSPAQLTRLQELLVESRDYFEDHHSSLARHYSRHFGLPANLLDVYWRGLVYHLGDAMRDGLTTFYRRAAEIGELETEPELRWV